MTKPPESLRAADGTALHLYRWPGEGTRGTVPIVHGLGEHGGRYAHVATWLAARGFTAVGYDHRGHGRSDGKRGVLPHTDALHTDLATVVDAVRAPNGPLLLLGHSMGARSWRDSSPRSADRWISRSSRVRRCAPG